MEFEREWNHEVDPPNGEGTMRDSLQRPRFPRWLIAVLAVVVIALLAGGYFFYRDQNQTARKTAQDELASIAQLKVSQIVQWRAERLADAGVISGTPFVREVVSRWLQTGQATDKEQILAWLQTVQGQSHYSGVTLVDPAGTSLLTVGSDAGALTQVSISGVEAAIASGKALLTDLYLDAGRSAHVDAIAPLFAVSGTSTSPLGAVVLHINANDFLYPLVQSWPTQSKSAETLLVRREDNSILFLNELRFRSGTALKLSYPLSKADLPAVMAAQGKQGIVEAPDYRGVKVLADLQPVPGSPWFMVAKVDVSEALAGTLLRSGLIWGLIAVLVIGVIGGTLLFWQWGLKRRYREAYAAEVERRGFLERFEHVVKQAADVILLADNDLRIVEANDLAAKTYGYSQEDLLRMRIPDLVPLDGQEAFAARMADAQDESAPAHETTHQRKDGSVFAAEVSDRKISLDGKTYYQAIVRDISERKRAEETIRESEAKTRSILNNISVGVALISPQMEILELNPRMREGFPAVDPSTHPICYRSLNNPPREAVCDYCPTCQTLQDGLVHEATTVTPLEGVVHSYRVVSSPIFNATGEVTAAIEMVEDVTEKLALESQLQQSQKMEAVGQLAGGIAHDFNNLLTSILGYSELLLTSGEISESPACKDVQEIKHAAERAGALTRQILAFSRRQALRPDVVSLNEVLNGMEPLLRRTLGENIDLVSLEHPDLGHAEIDVHQFEQVLMNLAINARDAMPAGGRLTLETANVELDEEYCSTHPEATPGACVMLAVSDTGIGMDEATLEHVFEPFFTTKAPGEGTGLGLATVFGIVKQSRGNIFVYSEPGKGTTFKIYLPRVATREAAEAVVLPDHTPSLGNEAVMVVEDESSLRSLIERVLGAAGYKVVCFGSADEAMAALEQGELAMDLLLTDVVLPGVMQGNDLARAAQNSRPDLPVLYMSGYTRNAIVHAGRLDEGINFLEKPFTPEALARMVRQVLDQAGAAG